MLHNVIHICMKVLGSRSSMWKIQVGTYIWPANSHSWGLQQVLLSQARSDESRHTPWRQVKTSASNDTCSQVLGSVWKQITDKQPLTFKKIVIFVFSVSHSFFSSVSLRIFSKSNKLLVETLFCYFENRHRTVRNYSQTAVNISLPRQQQRTTDKIKYCGNAVKC